VNHTLLKINSLENANALSTIVALSLPRFEKVVALIFCRIRNREIHQIRENRIKQNPFAYFAWFAVHHFHFEKSVFHPCPSVAKISP
jgi:hypothetical protein